MWSQLDFDEIRRTAKAGRVAEAQALEQRAHILRLQAAFDFPKRSIADVVARRAEYLARHRTCEYCGSECEKVVICPGCGAPPSQ